MFANFPYGTLDQLARTFRQHTAVQHWQPSAGSCRLVGQLIDLPAADDSGDLARLPGNGTGIPQPTLRRPPGRQLKQQIDARLRDCRSLPEIAAALGVSVSTLQRHFKAAYGATVIDYVRRRRLEMARAALTLEGLSIGEASYKAGYKHPSNFVAAFKKCFAVTPARLVRLHRSRMRDMESGPDPAAAAGNRFVTKNT